MILASRSGVVTWASDKKQSDGKPSAYGWHVKVNHEGEYYQSWYCHMNGVSVSVGDTVKQGDVLGPAGSTGNSTGVHLHMNIRKQGHYAGPGYAPADVVDPGPFLNTSPNPADTDLLPYIKGSGRLYEVKNAKGGQERFQSQDGTGTIFYQTKGDPANAQWEKMWVDSTHIVRDIDTSPGGGRYYRMKTGSSFGAPWIPRLWSVGGIFSRDAYVQFYNKADCSPSSTNSGPVTDTMKFTAKHASYTFRTGITLPDVVELLWVNGKERYFYARGFGLVAWERANPDPNTPEWSAISEIHAPGTRPDSQREIIPCLSP